MTDPSGHLDLDALADVLAGERDDAHLRTCRPCADRLAELATADATVTAALGALPAPTLPEGLSARLVQALHEERRTEQAVVRPLRHRRPPTWLPAAAAAAALVMAGAVGVSVLDPTAGQDSATSASDAGAGGGGQEAAPEAATGLAVPQAVPPAVTDWADEAARPTALARLLAPDDSTAGRTGDTTAGAASVDVLDRLRDPAALDACLSALPRGDDDVLAVDYAQFAGAPAVAVVQPADPGSLRLTVVGSGCSAGDPDVLATAVLPRP